MSEEVTLSKAQRFSRISYLLYRHPRGLTAAELAQLCGVTARTIQRDLRALDDMGVPIWEDTDSPTPRYGIVSGYYVPPVHLDLEDAVALYLAARLLARHAQGYDPHIAHALAKLATVLPEDIAGHVHATVENLLQGEQDSTFVSVLSTLALGWAGHRKVRVVHLSASDDRPAVHVMHPYVLEPSGVYYATYVIGHVEDVGGLRTYKVQRIRQAELLTETFEVPESFDAAALLRDAWGIMYGDEVKEVVLRFAPSATRRVKETLWHPSQDLRDEPDGGCILRLQVAHPRELLYWVRGWGPQVEVLAPDWLRRRVVWEAQELVRRYGEGGDVVVDSGH